jgi:hypothetical protein
MLKVTKEKVFEEIAEFLHNHYNPIIGGQCKPWGELTEEQREGWRAEAAFIVDILLWNDMW